MENEFREKMGKAIPGFTPDATVRQLMTISLLPSKRDRTQVYKVLYDEEMSNDLASGLQAWHKSIVQSRDRWEAATEHLEKQIGAGSVELLGQYSSFDEFVKEGLPREEREIRDKWSGHELVGAYMTALQTDYATLWPAKHSIKIDTRTSLQLYRDPDSGSKKNRVSCRQMAHLLRQE